MLVCIHRRHEGAGYPTLGVEEASARAGNAACWNEVSLQHGNRALQSVAPLAPPFLSPYVP